jgi:hypothetical protein
MTRRIIRRPRAQIDLIDLAEYIGATACRRQSDFLLLLKQRSRLSFDIQTTEFRWDYRTIDCRESARVELTAFRIT